MKHGPRMTLTLIACVSATACATHQDQGASSTRVDLTYFGQPIPGLIPELFAPGIINTDAIEFNGVFSPESQTRATSQAAGDAQ